MKNFLRRCACAIALAAVFMSPGAMAQGNSQRNGEISADGSVMVIPARAAFPLSRKITMGVGRSTMVQFPVELRDVMIGDPSKVDAIVQSSDRVFLLAKAAGTTNAFFFDANGNQIMSLEIVIGSDLSSLDNLLKRLIPTSNIRTELAGTAIVLIGTVRSPADATRAADIATQFASANQNLVGRGWTTQATSVGGVTNYTSTFNSGREGQSDKKVINMLSIDGEDQVMLKVTVAEVNRTVLKQFGINLGAELNVGNFATSILTANALPINQSTLGAIGRTVRNNTLPIGTGCDVVLPSAGGNFVSNSGTAGVWNSGSNCVSHTMRALERHGLVRTLAEPTLTAVSGEAAKFLAGGEYPVPVSSDNGAIGISFKEFGVGVAFTPVVLSEGRISLKIDTQVSELSNDGALVLSGTQIPSLRKRQALSTVELPSGGSLAMAGLISDTTRQNIDGMPGLKDLPILGTLFRSRDFQQSESELVVIVTPYVVRPTSRQNLAAPTDGLASPSDLKANFLGHLNRVYGRTQQLPDGGLKGNHGFIVD
ncbi:MAG: type II and III secretion system protein family protein [Hyphomicrobiales bacterium]|nr:type II and III secretion system protein family protein [Hyphomicrobiales bacterium]